MMGKTVTEREATSVEKARPYIVIDGNSLMHRAFYALPLLTGPDGVYTNAVYGFLNMLLRVTEEEKPERLFAAFDLHGPTFRHQEYTDYKAGRRPTPPELRPQFELVQKCLSAMRIPILTCPTFEADDILGTVSAECEQKGIPCLLVTGDRDSLQLVSESTNVLFTKKGVTEVARYTPDLVLTDFGVTPEQIPDLKGLMGDSSDHIPGVPGIGEKTAVKLLSQYGTLEEVLDHTDEIKGKLKERLTEGAASGIMSKKLATIIRTVPIDSSLLFECPPYVFSGAAPILKTLHMQSVLSRIEKIEGKPAPKSEADPQGIVWQELKTLVEPDDVRQWILSGAEEESTALTILLTEYGFSLAFPDGRRARVPFREGFLGEGFDPPDAAALLLSSLRDRQRLLLCDAKRFLTTLAGWGLFPSLLYDDSRIVQYLLQPQLGKYETPVTAEELTERFLTDKVHLYAQDMRSLYEDIELPLVETLFSMEREGFLVDREELLGLGRQYREKIEELRQDVFTLCGTDSFNLNSTQQLGEVLYQKLGLPPKKKTSRGYSTDAEALQAIRELHPVIDRILLYRQYTKLNSTYIEGLLPLIGKDGRIHTWFDQTITATGRISSSEPNLQNIPVRTGVGKEIRRAFIAKEGCVLVDADYSQIELRLLAHLSGDAAMCDAFRRGQDIHARTASEVYNIPIEEVTPEMRSRSKAVNFGIVYGISDFGLAANLHISRREAAEFIERYFERYPSVRAFMNECVAQGKSQGYSVTMFGRRRPLPELSSSNYNQRQFGERAAMNTPVQGAAADIIKIAMNKVTQRLQKEKLRARLILQVHDELIVETPLDEESRVREILRESMEQAADLSVPLIAEIHSGHSWADVK